VFVVIKRDVMRRALGTRKIERVLGNNYCSLRSFIPWWGMNLDGKR